MKRMFWGGSSEDLCQKLLTDKVKSGLRINNLREGTWATLGD